MAHSSSKKRQLWVGILVSLLCLVAIFFFIDPGEILASLQTARYDYLAFSTIGIILFMVIRAIRWRFMLNNDVPWRDLFHIQNIGYMLTMILPARLGDVARAVLIGNVPPVTLARGLSTMVVERILDMLFIVTLLPFTLAEVPILPGWMQSGARLSGILALLAIAILIIAANQRPLAHRLATWGLDKISFLETAVWSQRLDDLLAGLTSLTKLKDGVILLLLSVLVWLPIIYAYWQGLRAVGIEPTWTMAGFVVCAAALSIAAPSSPGQVGVFHAGVIAALQVLNQPEAASASFAFVYHALNLVIMVLLGLIGLAATGATLNNVVTTTQQFLSKEEKEEEPTT